MLTGMTAGQPGWLHDSVMWSAHTLQSNQVLWNTLFALTQVAIGLALLVSPHGQARPRCVARVGAGRVVVRRGVRDAVHDDGQSADWRPGSGAPVRDHRPIVWPNGRPGGLLGVRGARIAWGGVWVLMAWLWLEAPSSSANAISNAIKTAPSA